jgi:hypothetical protein
MKCCWNRTAGWERTAGGSKVNILYGWLRLLAENKSD